MKELKFQALVNEIQKEYEKGLEYSSWSRSEKKANMSGLLRLVFDYNEMNVYGKIAIDTAKFETPDGNSIFGVEGSQSFVKFCKLNAMTDEHEQKSERLWIGQGWAEHCTGNKYNANPIDSLMFIFWALLVVAVDQTEKAANLSTICDFAQILQVTDQEVKDLVELVKIAFGQSEYVVLNGKSHLENRSDPNREEKEAAIHMSIKSPRILKLLDHLIQHFTGVSGQSVQYGRENIHQIKRLNSIGAKLKKAGS